MFTLSSFFPPYHRFRFPLFLFIFVFFLLATKIGLTPIFADQLDCIDTPTDYTCGKDNGWLTGTCPAGRFCLAKADAVGVVVGQWCCPTLVVPDPDDDTACGPANLADKGTCEEGKTCVANENWSEGSTVNPYVCVPNDELPSDSLTLNLNAVNLKYSDLEAMNPLRFSSVFSDPDSRTPGAIINRALTVIIFPLAGIGLFVLILWGGFQMISGSATGKQNSIDLGKKKITTALVGFIILFCVYWLWRLVALATGLST